MTSAELVAATQRLRVDRTTADVVAALDRAGVATILLKGPSLARWLYSHECPRAYGDSDLLVAPESFARAQAVLVALGFTPLRLFRSGELAEPLHADTWRRARDRAVVDLHHTLSGARADPSVVWTVLEQHTATLRLGATDCRVLDAVALAAHVALHAAWHGTAVEQPVEDLRRALARLDAEDWRSAAELAERLGARDWFALGLRAVPDGADLADRLGLPVAAPVALRLQAGSAPPTALGLAKMARTPGWRAKAVLLYRKAFPLPGFMRTWSPLARRGRLGMAAAYLLRPLWLLAHLPAGARALRRERSRRPLVRG